LETHVVNPGSQRVNLFHSGFFSPLFNTQYDKHESRIIVYRVMKQNVIYKEELNSST